jgi:hypothetical protein
MQVSSMRKERAGEGFLRCLSAAIRREYLATQPRMVDLRPALSKDFFDIPARHCMAEVAEDREKDGRHRELSALEYDYRKSPQMRQPLGTVNHSAQIGQ